jgi:protocadherin-15
MILVIKNLGAEQVQHQGEQVIDFLEERSGLIVGVEKVSNLEFSKDNITLETDPSSTDFWFYTIDPSSERILHRNSTDVQK